MARLTRRSVLRGSVGVLAAGSLARPHIANAAATTATAWWAQGFAQEEDVALRKFVADYEKASGNTIDLSIVPFAPLRQKIISAITSGSVPDLIDANPLEIFGCGKNEMEQQLAGIFSSLPQYRGWLVDVQFPGMQNVPESQCQALQTQLIHSS